MELDELKLQLRQKLDESTHSKSELDIGGMLKKKTQSIINKLTRSLRKEIIFCVVFIMAFAAIGIFSKQWGLQIYFSTFSIICLIFLGILIYLLKRINQLANTILPIKNNLQTIHSIISEYVKRAFQFTMLLIPVCLAFSFWLGYNDKTPSDKIPFVEGFISSHLTTSKQLLLFLGVYALLLTVVAYFLTKWFLKKMYGNYLDQLQVCINELEE